jgi:transcriptional regulator of arginine metabolism
MQMIQSTETRRRALAELIRTNDATSQEELARGLAGRGFSVTQATISRDLEHLGAVKVRREGRITYALPEELDTLAHAGPDLSRIFQDWARSIEAAVNLVVIKTPPGSAHLIGSVLDAERRDDVVGTVCGDDTLFVACRSAEEAAALAAHFQALRSGPAH